MAEKGRIKELINAIDDLSYFNRKGMWKKNKVPDWIKIDIAKGMGTFEAIERKRKQALEVFSSVIQSKIENGGFDDKD